MKLTIICITLITCCSNLISHVDAYQPGIKCYGRFGCFSILPPFSIYRRPVGLFPFCAEKIDASFFLWTRENPGKEFIVFSQQLKFVHRSFFSGVRQTKIIIHGAFESADVDWVKRLKDKLLEHGDYNVIAINYKRAAYVSSYTINMSTARIVGAILADFIHYLERNYGIQSQSIHMIGFSLGGQIAGYVGERIHGIGRITGLDPASTKYDHNHPIIRLDPTDALFVDIIYTGLRIPYLEDGERPSNGHLTFSANDGRFQPGCPILAVRRKRGLQGLLRRFAETIACHHYRAVTLFIESFDAKCPLLAYMCDSYENFLRGRCHQGCGEDFSLCAQVGMEAEKWKMFSKPNTVRMFFKTSHNNPFCQHHYYVKISCYGNWNQVWMYGRNMDSLFISLQGSLKQSIFVQVDPLNIQHNTQPWIEFLLSFHYLGSLQEVQLRWQPSDSPLYERHNNIISETGKYCGQSSFNISENNCQNCPFSVKYVTVIDLETNIKNIFVGTGANLVRNEVVVFKMAHLWI